ALSHARVHDANLGALPQGQSICPPPCGLASRSEPRRRRLDRADSHVPNVRTQIRVLDSVAPHIPNFEFLVEDITHLSDEDISERMFEVYTRLVLFLLRDARSATTLMAKLPAWAESFSAALAAPNGADALYQLFRYISARHRSPAFAAPISSSSSASANASCSPIPSKPSWGSSLTPVGGQTRPEVEPAAMTIID